MRITRNAVTRTCAVCEWSLLVGERAVRFAPDGENFVDVCPLCQDIAAESGWLKEGSPTTPIVETEPRKRRLGLGSLFETRRPPPPGPVAGQALLRRPSRPGLRGRRGRGPLQPQAARGA